MASNLADKRLFFRFFSVSAIGTILDYLLALLLATVLYSPSIVAATCGFILGSIFNYCGHSVFSYEHTNRKTISFKGYLKYFYTCLFSLLLRLLVVALLGYFSVWPLWFILLVAISVSFISSYVIATLWAFKK